MPKEILTVTLPVTPDGGIRGNAAIPKGYKLPKGHIRITGFEKRSSGETKWIGRTTLEKE